jgi:hypothetical protein
MSLEFRWVYNWPYDKEVTDMRLERRGPETISVRAHVPETNATYYWYICDIKGSKEELDALDREMLKDVARMHFSERKINGH